MHNILSTLTSVPVISAAKDNAINVIVPVHHNLQ